ncbi:hypothetical protein CHLRE_12g492152v5 [Chlamydomonas reinhardtii]|uniref:Secreted protein n=1 Tax=Chlamydomonas reinhardtii TaxID=3055 RepID=A0A2K3D1Z3_CHLRE|nr:uncharacterized protein CHLRE_12g492152v5 [Chlamydomonas reinhardtii]PNW74539.1 hypothetical protein CHLRE_12g492152v5 [Chlamydomonas reinhardtii]
MRHLNLISLVQLVWVGINGPTAAAASEPAWLGPAPTGGVHVRSGGGEQGHVGQDSAASPKKRRQRAG